ncbi:MAG: DUF1475 family protein [Bacillota bacterium]
MKTAKFISWLGLLAMAGVLFYGFTAGDFFDDGSELMANPWGVVSMVDLYVGFILFSMWIAFREKNVALAIIWIILMMVFGFLTASAYLLITLYQSREDWLLFFLGARKKSLLKQNHQT